MNLEEIINAAVEKQVNELVEEWLSGQGGYWEAGLQLQEKVASVVTKIAEQELLKHEDAIRSRVIDILTTAPSSFKFSIHTQIESPKEK